MVRLQGQPVFFVQSRGGFFVIRCLWVNGDGEGERVAGQAWLALENVSVNMRQVLLLFPLE